MQYLLTEEEYLEYKNKSEDTNNSENAQLHQALSKMISKANIQVNLNPSEYNREYINISIPKEYVPDAIYNILECKINHRRM